MEGKFLNHHCKFNKSPIGLELMLKCVIHSGINILKSHFFGYSPEGTMSLPSLPNVHIWIGVLSKRGGSQNHDALRQLPLEL
jgi:hypothetical protein